jgi:hypothetical protein
MSKHSRRVTLAPCCCARGDVVRGTPNAVAGERRLLVRYGESWDALPLVRYMGRVVRGEGRARESEEPVGIWRARRYA